MLVDLIVSQKLSDHWRCGLPAEPAERRVRADVWGGTGPRIYSENTRGVLFGIQATYEY
jgi:hypothetical protein